MIELKCFSWNQNRNKSIERLYRRSILYFLSPRFFSQPCPSYDLLIFHFRSRIPRISKFARYLANRNAVLLLLPPPLPPPLRWFLWKRNFHESFHDLGLWYPGNPLCRGYNQLNTSTPFNSVIVDTVHARTKGVVDFKLPLKLVSSRRNLIPPRFTYRKRQTERREREAREENHFGSVGITERV